MTMTRDQALPYVAYVVDDALWAGTLEEWKKPPAGQEPNAVLLDKAVLVGWQCGFEPLYVAVVSYLDVTISASEAEGLATEYMTERGWFGLGSTDRSPRPADYIHTQRDV